jgi:broad specificity phosphatase PhoE
MRLLLVRHGQPRWSMDGAAINDPGLTELGADQARAAAERLQMEPDLTELVVSPARRSQETAAPIAERCRLPVVTDDWLHEIRLPAAWDGTPAEEVGRVLTEARTRPASDWWDGLPGGESFGDFHERVTNGLDATLRRWGVTRHGADPDNLWSLPDDSPRTIVVVAHAGTNSLVLGHLLGLQPTPWEWERFASDHASVTELRTTPIAGGHIFSLQSFSDTRHLGPTQISG